MASNSGGAHSMGGVARISYQQLICLIFVIQSSAAVLFLPTSSASAGGSGGWLAPLVAMLLGGLPTSLLVGALVRRHPGQGMGELAANLLGGFWGRLVALVLALFALLLTILSVRDVVELIPLVVLPTTPLWATAIPFMLVVVYGAYSGAEVLARLAVPTLLGIVATLVLEVLTLSGNVHPLRLLPLVDRGIGQLFEAGWPAVGWFAESWSFLPFVAMVDKSERAAQGLVLSALLASLVLALQTALAIGVFGPDMVAHFAFPVYSLVQQITIGEFVERLDVFLITIWLVGMIVKVSGHLWVAMNSAAFVLGMKNERPLLLLLGSAALCLIGLIPNLPRLVEFSTKAWNPISLSLGLLLPGLLLAASWIRSYRCRNRGDLGA